MYAGRLYTYLSRTMGKSYVQIGNTCDFSYFCARFTARVNLTVGSQIFTQTRTFTDAIQKIKLERIFISCVKYYEKYYIWNILYSIAYYVRSGFLKLSP